MNPILNAKEREIIACSFFRSDMSVRQIAKETGLREHVVRFSLKSLHDRGLLSERVFINPFAMGFTEYQIFLKILTPGENARLAVAEALKLSPYTTYVASIGGAYQLSCMVLARHLGDLDTFFQELSNKTRDIVFEKLITPCLSVTLFQPRYLSRTNYSNAALTYAMVEEPIKLDQRDLRVVSSLLEFASGGLTRAAKEIGMALTSFEYRVQTLKERGIILGFGRYITNYYQEGLIPSFIRVSTKNFTEQSRQRFFCYCQTHPQISYLIRCLGPWDYEVGIRVLKPTDTTTLVEELKMQFQNEIGQVEVLPFFDLIKLEPNIRFALENAKAPQRAVGA